VSHYCFCSHPTILHAKTLLRGEPRICVLQWPSLPAVHGPLRPPASVPQFTTLIPGYPGSLRHMHGLTMLSGSWTNNLSSCKHTWKSYHLILQWSLAKQEGPPVNLSRMPTYYVIYNTPATSLCVLWDHCIWDYYLIWIKISVGVIEQIHLTVWH